MHVAQVIDLQVEQTSLTGQDRALTGRKLQIGCGLIGRRLPALVHQDLTQSGSIDIDGVRAVLIGVGQGDGALLPQVLDIQRLPGGHMDDPLSQLGRA